VRIVLSPYTFVTIAAIVLLIAAVAAWALFRPGGVMRRTRTYDWLNLPSELPAILNEFERSLEAAHEEVRRGTKVSDAMMAAIGPIDQALRDFKNRISELEKRADESGKQLAELKSALAERHTSLDTKLTERHASLETKLTERQTSLEGKLAERQKSLEENARAIERGGARLDGLDKQLAPVSEKLSNLVQLTENEISRHDSTRDELRAAGSGLAAAQAQLTGLSQRVDAGEAGHAHLSALAEAAADALAALKAGAKDTSQKIATLEPRILWKIEELEALINATRAAMEKVPVDDGGDAVTSVRSVT
jgi:chromosome segregation ATPase